MLPVRRYRRSIVNSHTDKTEVFDSKANMCLLGTLAVADQLWALLYRAQGH